MTFRNTSFFKVEVFWAATP